MTDQNQTPETLQDVPDRRETIEAAFEAAEKPNDNTQISNPAGESADGAVATQLADSQTSESESGASAAAKTPAEGTDGAAVSSDASKDGNVTDRAPQSWKAPLKAKWDKLDPDIRQEVLRRERETTQVLNDSAQARQFTQHLLQTVQPYQARLKQIGANPVQAMERLLKADQFLASAPTAARAQYMATLIKGYGVDIAALDAALADTGTTASDPVTSKVEQLLRQRLAPFQSFIKQQQQRDTEQQTEQERVSASVVEQMAQDPKYPHFEAVRGLMADLIEFSASKGQTLTIEAAYNRAIALDPTVSQVIANQTASQTIAASTALARRALNASASVSGTPGGTARTAPNASDRRATIEAAFSAAEGR